MFVARCTLEICRTVPEIVFALIFVLAYGLGAADKRPVEGVISTGGHHMHGVRFGLSPQVIPVLASQIL